ncbi:MAG: aminotransferase class III-fold pyridoxal phosphate-dependent enzyme [Patescibacteria group bacterium]|jgi:glutamate-1-semialdehyde 2,1-aminomutase|nr:aminotransferase class III-fold pyridoxal phosphate-dependent enzyme [Patescibacteria group bacterium]
MKNRYQKSNQAFKKINRLIPLASQTFSKSYLQYVKGTAPLFVSRAKGCRIWDVDGNEYVDMINSLLAVSLGYNHPSTNRAIAKQLKKGISFSLATLLEGELAELLIKYIPSAEMVRFGKNGSDATTGAIRLARAITGREEIAVCGFHGWHDWYIGSTTRKLGVPKSTVELTHKFEYNNLESLAKIFKSRRNKIAAVIMEPMSYEWPKDNFLAKVKKLAHQHGALLIFDEVITGFRFGLGGAQKYFEVTPDLSCFGKSMANGMPISALVGKRQYMKRVEDIFYSFTFGGESLSLAVAIATIQEMKNNNFSKVIDQTGKYLKIGTERIIKKHGLMEVVELKGANHWQIFFFHDHRAAKAMEIKSYVQEELLARGVLWYGQHNISFSHRQKDLDFVLSHYNQVFELLSNQLAKGVLSKGIKSRMITDIFKVR